MMIYDIPYNIYFCNELIQNSKDKEYSFVCLCFDVPV